ncbi:transglycosylase SLT domain-containing protein [Shewanella sp. M16]|uniref:transglycosylase SLT domain-containing protein n=1 Tax=Shewanella sp. M16 TaxID=2830837 RepID=UPI001BAECAD5|nr:transglycosylase SLT domain-containing protein [Shewanella sp. M16]MBS0045208.1 transglycosylase SLT domain-containing protein [Shewanella sp. M16]
MLLELAFMAQMLKECQTEVEPNLLIGLITNNPYSISVMGAETATPPETEGEATKVINDLAMKRISFNAGMMKIHNGNFQELGIDNNNVFDVCTNIKAGASILAKCLPETDKTTPEAILSLDHIFCSRDKASW